MKSLLKRLVAMVFGPLLRWFSLRLDGLGVRVDRVIAAQVVLLSGHGGEELGLRGMAYGAYAYLLKPVSLKTLVETAYRAFEEGFIG